MVLPLGAPVITDACCKHARCWISMPILLVLGILWALVSATPMSSANHHTLSVDCDHVFCCTESWRGFAENVEEPTPKPFGQSWGDGASPPGASARHGHPQVGPSPLLCPSI